MGREMLMLIDALAREKNVERQIIISALESALAAATKKALHQNHMINVTVHLDAETGSHTAFRQWEIVNDEDFVDAAYQVPISAALVDDDAAQVNDIIKEELESVDLGRISAQIAKQVILQKVKEAEKEQLLNEFLERDEQVVTAQVKRLDKGDLILETHRVEMRLPKDQMIPRENLRTGDRIRVYVKNVQREARYHPVTVSRIMPELLIELFKFEVPEIENGTIDILSAAREPGLRSKISVRSHDTRVDAQGTCIGLRGSRVSAVINELAGERIDIVLWSEDPAQYVINALAPAVIDSIVLDETTKSMDAVVNEDNLAIAIGRGGENVKLASELTGWKINLLTEEELNEQQETEAASARDSFIEKLSIDEEVASLLVEEGFLTLEEVAYVPVEELLSIPDLSEDQIMDLRESAKNILLTEAIASEAYLNKADDSLLSLEGIDNDLAAKLAKNHVLTRDDLADLSTDELIDITEIEKELAEKLIREARSHWFSNESSQKDT